MILGAKGTLSDQRRSSQRPDFRLRIGRGIFNASASSWASRASRSMASRSSEGFFCKFDVSRLSSNIASRPLRWNCVKFSFITFLHTHLSSTYGIDNETLVSLFHLMTGYGERDYIGTRIEPAKC